MAKLREGSSFNIDYNPAQDCIAKQERLVLFSGKEYMYLFLLGAALLLGSLAVSGLRRFGITKPSRFRGWATVSLILMSVSGMVLGMVVGANSDFGSWLIAWFNPRLPEQDFQVSFGALGGGLLGMFVGALVGGLVQWARFKEKAG
ncbi:MAG: hypothetical protein VX438_13770 [Planctomycetota bacterium]|nr:hypothetical protein [Planctomycetota bacterium]